MVLVLGCTLGFPLSSLTNVTLAQFPLLCPHQLNFLFLGEIAEEPSSFNCSTFSGIVCGCNKDDNLQQTFTNMGTLIAFSLQSFCKDFEITSYGVFFKGLRVIFHDDDDVGGSNHCAVNPPLPGNYISVCVNGSWPIANILTRCFHFLPLDSCEGRILDS